MSEESATPDLVELTRRSFTAVRLDGRPVGSTGHVELRYAGFTAWADGVAERVANYTDISEARADAQHLAEGRE